MNGFRRGFSNRNPLVLVCAICLAGIALLGVEAVFVSGAWTAVPMKYWMRNSRDDYMYVSWMTSELKRQPPRLPLVTLLGGSSAREALVSGPSLAREVRAAGGPRVLGYSLTSRMQRYAQSWAIIDSLPDTPTTVLVGVNLGRFTTSPSSNYDQVIGRELLLKSDSLRRWVVARSGRHKYSYTILPGIFSALATYAQAREKDLELKGRLHTKPYTFHPFDKRKDLSAATKRAMVEKWLTQYYPAFRRVLDFNVAMLDQLVREGQRCGLDMVIVELPLNREIVGASFAAALAAYRGPTQAIAAKYDVPYLDFNRRVAIPSSDFLDLSHLRPEGRAVWQAELARQLAGLYNDGTLRTAP